MGLKSGKRGSKEICQPPPGIVTWKWFHTAFEKCASAPSCGMNHLFWCAVPGQLQQLWKVWEEVCMFLQPITVLQIPTFVWLLLFFVSSSSRWLLL
ncbi:hypothetical protein TNCV_646741 [Trichonephila clavipes]|nr:hypothetical protein TNCV_646741 [Trichonephila clavipes]